MFDYAVEHHMLEGVEDFYENKHVNSDLLSVNFTQYTDDEVHKALHDANMKLLMRYQEVQAENNAKICEDLYLKKDASFRGFRQT